MQNNLAITILQCVPRTNLKKWKEFMLLIAKRDYEDIAEAMISKDETLFIPPAIPLPPKEPGQIASAEQQQAFYVAANTFDLQTKPKYQSEFKTYLKRIQTMAMERKKLYALIMLHISEDSKNRIKAETTKFAPIEATSDGISLFKIACETHVFNGGDVWTQQQTQIGILSSMKQGYQPIEAHLTMIREQMDYLEEIDSPLSASDAISKTIMSLNKAEFGQFVTDRSLAGTIPKTFPLLVTALLHYSVTTKSVKELFGSPVSKQTGWSEVTNLAEHEEIHLSTTVPKEKFHKKVKQDYKHGAPTKDQDTAIKQKLCAWCRSHGKTHNNHVTDDCGHLLRFLSNQAEGDQKKDK